MMKTAARFLILNLAGLSSIAQAAVMPSENPLKASISRAELDTQLASNANREEFLRKELNKKVTLLSKIQNGASAPTYLWEEIPANQRNRGALEKLLKLAIRRHLDEIARVQQINTELSAQLDWMNHEVAGATSSLTTTNPGTTPLALSTANRDESTPSFHCSNVPVAATSFAESPLLQDFGTRKDSLTGLEWNSLGWWISQKATSAVKACSKGKVVFSGPMTGRGHVVMLDHGDDFLTIYANLAPQNTHAKLGAQVRTGETIGNSQDSVYFEVRHRGKAVNPRLVFARQNLNILGL